MGVGDDLQKNLDLLKIVRNVAYGGLRLQFRFRTTTACGRPNQGNDARLVCVPDDDDTGWCRRPGFFECGKNCETFQTLC